MAKLNPRSARIKRHQRVRFKVKGTADRPRLTVFRSLNNIYAQIINDEQGQTLVAASTLEDGLDEMSGKSKKDKSGEIGKLLGKRAIEKGIIQVAFDRGGYKYQGRVKALAEAAREAGLKF